MLQQEMRRFDEDEKKADEELLKNSTVSIPLNTQLKNIEKKEKADNSTDFYNAVALAYPRWVDAEGPLKDRYIYWVEEVDGKLNARCTKSLKSRTEEEDLIQFDIIPNEISWIVDIYRKGIHWWGRNEHPYDDKKRNYKKNLIAEVITSTEFKYKDHLVEIFLMRFCGENMGSAAWMRRSELQGCEKLIREYEKEKLKKGDRLAEYNLSYHGITALNAPKTLNFNFTDVKPHQTQDITSKNEQHHYLQTITKNEPYKNTKFMLMYNPHDKNRSRNKKSNEIKMLDDVSCLFHSINSLYQIWPKRAMQILYFGKSEKWSDIKIKIEKCLKKYSPQFELSILYQNEKAQGTLKANIEKLVFLKDIDCVLCYHIKNTITGHAGVMKNGKIQNLKIYKYEARKKLDKKNYIYENQDKFKEDLKYEISEMIVFVLKEIK